MNSFTFKIITERRSEENQDLYDLFLDTIVDKNIPRFEDIVREGEDGRLDMVSKRIYGSKNYVEELMVINNILNPFSIVEGQQILYVAQSQIEFFREPEETPENTENIASPKNKNTRKDPKREKGVPPTIKPLDFEQIMVDRKNKTIRLNTKLS